MDWIRNENSWESGPYIIEMVGPLRWMLTRNDESDPSGALVRAEDEWTGRTLSQMKAMAATIEKRRVQANESRVYLRRLFLAALALGSAAGGSGRISAVVVIVSAGIVIQALASFVGHRGPRPWETLRQGYQ
jgi:hypothetical protein